MAQNCEQICFSLCTDDDDEYTHFGLQYGFECWCSPDGGLDYDRHYDRVGEDAVCDMDCLGDEVRTNFR